MEQARQDAFTAWVLSDDSPYNADADSVAGYINKIEQIEGSIGINIDEEYEKDGLACLYISLRDDTVGYRHPNQALMGWAADVPKNTLDSYSTAVNHYRLFREATG